MKFKIEKSVFDKIPDLVVAVPVILGFDNNKSQREALEFLRKSEEGLKATIDIKLFWKDKRVTSYLDCFRNFGVDPEKFRPAHVALVKRVLEGEQLPDINPMVNLYNAMSIKYLTPFGGENLDSLYGDFILRFAQGGEQWISIGGGKSKPAIKGELVWGDNYDLSTRALNWRQCDRTKMTENTTNGYFIMDGFEGVNREIIEKAAEEFINLATKLLGGKANVYWLTKDQPEAEVPFETRHPDQAKSAEGSSKVDRSLDSLGSLGMTAKGKKDATHIFDGLELNEKESLAYQIRQIVYEAVKDLAVPDFSMDEVKIEHPKVESFGDYSTNVAMILSQNSNLKTQIHISKLKSARDVALEIVDRLKKKIQKDKESVLENAEVAGGGFINLWLNKEFLVNYASKIISDSDKPVSSLLIGKKLAVEYTDPNPFKEFHLGHLYSNVIGESISRIFEACGALVWRGDFYGDVGMHIAKSLYGFLLKIKNQNAKIKNLKGKDYIIELRKEIGRLEKLSVFERQKFLGEGYALGVIDFEKDEKVQAEIKNINLLIYVVGQELLKKKKGWEPIIDYKKYLRGKEDKLRYEEVTVVYEAGLHWSLEYFEMIYKKLGTKFDGYYPESWVGEYGMKLVEKGLVKGILEKSDEAVVFRGEREGLHTRVFVNKLGLPTYETKDLGLAQAKYQDFPYDRSLNIFGKEIDEYYYVVKAALKKIEPDLGNKAFHLAHGMVKLPEGKMSSRTGNVVTFWWLLNEAKKQALKLMKNLNLSNDERDQVAEKVSLGAIKYALLRSNIGTDVVFDFGKSISFEGDSGPYLMYTYARCKSVIRKADNGVSRIKYHVLRENEEQNKNILNTKYVIRNTDLNPEEFSLLRTLYRFEEVVSEAARTLSPNLVCTYLYDLAQKFNLFYNKHSILSQNSKLKTQNHNLKLKTEDDITIKQYNNKTINDNKTETNTTVQFRLMLTESVSVILKKGLHTLGIETVERM